MHRLIKGAATAKAKSKGARKPDVEIVGEPAEVAAAEPEAVAAATGQSFSVHLAGLPYRATEVLRAHGLHRLKRTEGHHH